MLPKQKRPREYAFEIARLTHIDDRRAALEQVPEEWRDLVKTHLKIIWDRKNWAKRKTHGTKTGEI